MKIAVGSDEQTSLTDFVLEELGKKGFNIVKCGALVDGKPKPWPLVAKEVAEKILSGECSEGILFCWTGTGVCIAANKFHGIRAALCFDAETAKGARKWNHANILVMSLRLTSQPVAKEILDSWFSTPYDPNEEPMIKMLTEIEQKH